VTWLSDNYILKYMTKDSISLHREEKEHRSSVKKKNKNTGPLNKYICIIIVWFLFLVKLRII